MTQKKIAYLMCCMIYFYLSSARVQTASKKMDGLESVFWQ